MRKAAPYPDFARSETKSFTLAAWISLLMLSLSSRVCFLR